jgi:hypothetical protein
LCVEIEVINLPWRAFVPLLLEGVCDGLVIGENGEVTRFQHVVEMLHGLVDCQQFAIVCAVLLLGLVQLPGEEDWGCQVFNPFLQHGTHGGSGGVRDKCTWRGWVRVCQESGP